MDLNLRRHFLQAAVRLASDEMVQEVALQQAVNSPAVQQRFVSAGHEAQVGREGAILARIWEGNGILDLNISGEQPTEVRTHDGGLTPRDDVVNVKRGDIFDLKLQRLSGVGSYTAQAMYLETAAQQTMGGLGPAHVLSIIMPSMLESGVQATTESGEPMVLPPIRGTLGAIVTERHGGKYRPQSGVSVRERVKAAPFFRRLNQNRGVQKQVREADATPGRFEYLTIGTVPMRSSAELVIIPVVPGETLDLGNGQKLPTVQLDRGGAVPTEAWLTEFTMRRRESPMPTNQWAEARGRSTAGSLSSMGITGMLPAGSVIKVEQVQK